MKKSNEEALTRAAQRLLRKEKNEALLKSRRTTMDYPKRIEAERKVATRGIVKLFNAIKAHQKEALGVTEDARKPAVAEKKQKRGNSIVSITRYKYL